MLITSKYPRIIYSPNGGASRTIDGPDPLLSDAGPQFVSIGGSQISTSGVLERSVFRGDEMRRMVWQWGYDAQRAAAEDPRPAGTLTAQLNQFLSLVADGSVGQFELLVNRFQGAVFEFLDTLADENANVGTVDGDPITYADSEFDTALVLTSGNHLEIPRVPATNAPRLIPAEGTIVLIMVPAFTGDDSAQHTLLNCQVSALTNQLSIKKDAANDLNFTIYDPTSGEGGRKTIGGAVNWTAGTRQVIVVSYQPDGTLQFFLNGQAFGAPSGAGTGILGAMGTEITLGSDLTLGLNPAPGDYERLALYTKGYTLTPSVAEVLARAVTTDRNYFAKAELVEATQPQRVNALSSLYQMPLVIRKGV